MSGIYIHIPFCASRCIYCGFFSTTRWRAERQRYVGALCREMRLRKDYLQDFTPIRTIYLGGGTPSQLIAEELRQIFLSITETFQINYSDLEEITIECNPDDITPEYASLLGQLPVNRVSMGAQTFDTARLRFLHRRHTPEEVSRAVGLLRDNGINNISIDLMFGFPDETLDQWKGDIDKALSLNVEHISAYSLMYEEGTPLYHLLTSGKIQEISDDDSLAMYSYLIDTLTAAGYEHYEISNFARPGFRSRHNSSYWHEVPYLGLGAAAHSYNLTSRQWNVADLSKYIDSIENGVIPAEKEMLDLNTRYDDLITTALRTREGFDLDHVMHDYGPELYSYLMASAQGDLQKGNLKIIDNQLSITRKGLFISDSIMSNLMHPDDI